MTNINLYESFQKQEEKGGRDMSIVISLGVLVVILVVFGGLKIYSGVLQEEISSTQEEIQRISNEVDDQAVNAVYDTNLRLQNMKETLASLKKGSVITDLEQLQSVVLPNVQVSQYEYDKENGKMGVIFVGADTRTTAQQLFSYKSNEYFSDVSLEAVGINSDGKITFEISSRVALK